MVHMNQLRYPSNHNFHKNSTLTKIPKKTSNGQKRNREEDLIILRSIRRKKEPLRYGFVIKKIFYKNKY